MELIAAVMKAPTSAERFETAKNLLSYGFANYTLVDVYPNEALPTIPVSMGKKDSVQPIFASRDKLLVEKTKVSSVEKNMELVPHIAAPVEEGQELGTLTITSEGETLITIPLVAGGVRRTPFLLGYCTKIIEAVSVCCIKSPPFRRFSLDFALPMIHSKKEQAAAAAVPLRGRITT